jgi:mycothiol synthase
VAAGSTDPIGTDPIDVLDQLSESQQAQVRSLLEAATDSDGVAPVSEHVVLRLRAAGQSEQDGGGGRHLLLGADPLRGYGYFEDAATGPESVDDGVREAEFVVHPDHRRAGRGRALLHAVASGAPAGGVRVWSHGDQPGARALARALGYRVVRTLLQLRRPLGSVDELGLPVFPPGVVLRSFRPGEDDAGWLRLNARAFAHHPEQGRTTQSDLQERMEEPWFDPKGFLIAERDGVMVGFHWTKIHPGGVGEVYVVGVDPDLHGGGLGRALTLAGLRYLAERGLGTVLLYVESDNAPALAVYHRLGFTSWITDVNYAGPPETGS